MKQRRKGRKVTNGDRALRLHRLYFSHYHAAFTSMPLTKTSTMSSAGVTKTVTLFFPLRCPLRSGVTLRPVLPGSHGLPYIPSDIIIVLPFVLLLWMTNHTRTLLR